MEKVSEIVPNNPEERILVEAEGEKRISIERRKYDETGAQREHEFHKALGEKLNKYLHFEKTPDDHTRAFIAPEIGKGTVFEAVVARDLNRMNKEGGHSEGDQMLNVTVQETRKAIEAEPTVAEYEVFHTQGADFIAIVGVKQEDAEQTIANIEEKLDTVAYGTVEGAEKGGVTSVSVTLGEAVEFFNKYMQAADLENQYQDADRAVLKKLFADQTIKYIKHRTETEKLVDMARTYAELYKEPSEEAERYFNNYIGLFLKGINEDFNEFEKFAKISQDAEAMEAYTTAVEELAFRRTFEGEFLGPKIWEIMSTEIEWHSSQMDQLLDTVEEKEPPVQVVEAVVTIEESKETIRAQFKEEKAYYRTPNAEYIQTLGDFVNELSTTLETSNWTAKQIEESRNLLNYLIEHGELVDSEGTLLEDVNKLNQSIERLAQIKERQDVFHIEAAEDWVSGMHLQRLKELVNYADLTRQELLTQYDRLTGLPNKILYEEALERWRSDPELTNNFTIVSIDLGFLKYFNYIGSRETGDVAIQKSGWLLNEAKKVLEEQGFKVEIFKTGGDEFQILIGGKAIEEQTKATKEAISEVCMTQNETFGHANNVIPRAAEARDTFIEEGLVFDMGAAHSLYSKFFLYEYLHEEHIDFSEQEIEDINFLIRYETTPKEKLTSEDLERYDQIKDRGNVEVYQKALSEIQMRLADKTADTQKTKNRFIILFEKFSDTIDQGGDLEDYTKSVPTDNMPWRKFVDLLSYSGKTMEGKTMTDFYNVYKELKTNTGKTSLKEVTDEEVERAVKQFYGNTSTDGLTQTEQRSYIQNAMHQARRSRAF